MMGRREDGQGQFFYAFDLDKVVPPSRVTSERREGRALSLTPQGHRMCLREGSSPARTETALPANVGSSRVR